MCRLILLLTLTLLSGCVTLNTSQNCGEHNSIKASDNDTPKTNATVQIPLLK